MQIELKHDESGLKVIVTGNADLSLASAFRDVLLDALSSSSSSVEIDLSHITALNVNCLQLLWAASKEAVSLGIPLSILKPKEPMVLESLREVSLHLPADVAAGSPAVVCA